MIAIGQDRWQVWPLEFLDPNCRDEVPIRAIEQVQREVRNGIAQDWAAWSEEQIRAAASQRVREDPT